MSKAAFIAGFIKQAQARGYYHLKNAQALHNHADQAYETAYSKQAMFGPITDLSMMGLPSAAGAVIGHNYSPISNKELEEEVAYSDNPSISKALKYMLLPGYTGYRMAKNQRLEHAYDKYREANKNMLPTQQ
jgi:hypothetical protein